MALRRIGATLAACLPLLAGCAASKAPCFTVNNDSELRATDAARTVNDLSRHIHLSPQDEALRTPKSIADVKAALLRDVVYAFADAAAYAHGLDTTDGRFTEAQLELLLGESQLFASQILSAQQAWVGGDLRIARARLASEVGEPTTDRDRMLAQLIRVVEEGNKIADALGVVGPSHLSRGAVVIRRLRAEAPADPRTFALLAEYHRLRGEWTDFDAAMKRAEPAADLSRALCYLRGMEQFERFHRPDLGRNLLRGCLARFPGLVRAQVGVVLMSKTSNEALVELEKLKQMNQDHYLVMLLEPTLVADQELDRMESGGEQDAPR